MATLQFHVAIGGVAVPVEVHHKETIEGVTRRALESLFGPEAAPPAEHCQMLLGEEALDMNTKIHEIDLDTGVQLTLIIPF